jgi:vacuolar-type H+-ATPase subunit I/STV1
MNEPQFKLPEKRLFVKIIHSKSGSRSLAQTVYFRNEMTVDFYFRWEWYFKYRAALLRVKNPKNYTELIQGTYEYTPKTQELQKRVQDKIRGKKAKITQVKNQLKKVEKEWRELWPIHEDERYKNTINKIAEMEAELQELLKTQ